MYVYRHKDEGIGMYVWLAIFSRFFVGDTVLLSTTLAILPTIQVDPVNLGININIITGISQLVAGVFVMLRLEPCPSYPS